MFRAVSELLFFIVLLCCPRLIRSRSSPLGWRMWWVMCVQPLRVRPASDTSLTLTTIVRCSTCVTQSSSQMVRILMSVFRFDYEGDVGLVTCDSWIKGRTS